MTRAAPFVASRQYGVARWRTLECAGVALALLLLSSAVFPLVDHDGFLDPGEQATLRLLGLPVYVISGGLLLRHPRALLIAIRRTLPFALLLFVLPFVSVLWSVSPAVTLQRAVALTGSTCLAYLLAIRFTPRQFQALTVGVLGLCMVMSLLMVGAQPSRASQPFDVALRGVFTNKNALGWHAAIAALASGMMAADAKSPRRGIALAVFVVSLASLVASQSATALAAAASSAIVAGFYVALKRCRGLSRALLVLVVLQLTGFVLVSLDTLLLPALEALGKDATLTGRVPLWNEIDKQIEQHLLLGFGYQAFWTDASMAAWQVKGTAGWPAPHAHNGFRDTLLSFGLVGFALLMWTIWEASRMGARLLIRKADDGWLWLNVLSGTFLVLNFTESTMLFQNNLLFLLYATAVIMFLLRGKEPDVRPPPPGAAGGWGKPELPRRTA